MVIPCRLHGFKAFLVGESVENNPYQYNDSQYFDWEIGWNCAKGILGSPPDIAVARDILDYLENVT